MEFRVSVVKKVLIVEDRQENITAAQEFFDGQGISIDIAITVEEAIQKLQETVYLAAILDVELPRSQGRDPERLGPEVGKVAKEMEVPHVYLTAGYFHHGPRAKVFIDEFCLEHEKGKMVPGKADPGSWAKAYETLQSLGNLEETLESRLRYQRRTGKIYRR